MKMPLCSLFAASLLCLLSLTVSAADDVSLPPAADLEFQVDEYIKEFDKSLEDLAASKDFAADANVLARDANALTLVALAIGMSEDGKYKAAAPEIIKAAQTVAAAKDLAAAKAGVAAVKAALGKKSTDKLEWKKVAKMEPTMKLAVPRINTGMTRYVRNEATLKKGVPIVAGGTAALAAMAQGLKPNFDETIKPGNEDDWVKLSRDFRDAALKANAAVNAFGKGTGSFDDFKTALSAMKESCEHCHAVFTEGVSVE